MKDGEIDKHTVLPEVRPVADPSGDTNTNDASSLMSTGSDGRDLSRRVLPAIHTSDPLAVKIPAGVPSLRPVGYGMPKQEARNGAAPPMTEEEEAVMGYDEQIAALKAAAAAAKRETPEEKAKRERQEKSKKTIAATVDGLSALSNLFFTTQYAPNAYNPQSSQLGKVNERIEALKAERQADADRYTSLMLRLGDAQNAKAKTIRDMRAQHEAQKLAREEAERRAKEHGWKALLQDDIREEQKAKAGRAKHQEESARYEAENKPESLRLDNENKKASIRQKDAAAAASRASATNSLASAQAHNRSNISEYKGLGSNGKYESFSTRQAAIDFERREGTYDPSRWGDDVETESTVTEDLDGKKTTSTKKKYPKGQGYGGGAGKGAGYGN